MRPLLVLLAACTCREEPVEVCTLATAHETTGPRVQIVDATPDTEAVVVHTLSCVEHRPRMNTRPPACAESTIELVPLGYGADGEVLAWAHCPHWVRQGDDCMSWIAGAAQRPSVVRWRYDPRPPYPPHIWYEAVTRAGVPTHPGAPFLLPEGR